MKKNIALFDSTIEEARDFIAGLEKSTCVEWEAKVFRANQGRKNKLYDLIRYIKYFLFPLVVFLDRKKYNCIIGWQAFYGLLFAFYCRLFHVKKVNRLVIKNFIYKPKKGWIGKIYFSFMKYIVKSEYVDLFICSSYNYCDYCATTFNESRARFVFLTFGVEDFTKAVETDKPATNDYILALGRSNRDWDFLIRSLSNTEYQVKIVCDELHRKELPENIKIFNNVWQNESYEFIRNCKLMVIPILDGGIVAGETVLIQALSFSKPVIITSPSCLADDYITNGETGVIIQKNEEELRAAIKQLLAEDMLYEKIAHNSRALYDEQYSLFQFGKKVGNTMKEKGILLS